MGRKLTDMSLPRSVLRRCLQCFDWLIAAAAQSDDMARDSALKAGVFVLFVCLYPPREDD